MIADALTGALCVLAAMSAGSSMRIGAKRLPWIAGAVVVAACGMSGAAAAVALVLAAVAGFAGFRFGRSEPNGSSQALFATIAFVAWLLPDAPGLSGACAVLAGGACAALVRRMSVRVNRESVGLQPLHLACAGACAALAYVLGAQAGALAVLPVLALVVLIGAHLSLAIGGSASAPVANLMSGVSSCGLAAAAVLAGTHGALVVAAAALAIGCAQHVALAGIVREVP